MLNETKFVHIHRNDMKIFSVKFSIGVFLAIASSLFIGTSFILKKKGLLRLSSYHGAIRAGSGGYGYLREFQWWTGLATMGLGELCNFTAYGFAPASVVTPLGALSVLVSALLSVRFLGEKLNLLGKIGCILTISGSVILVIHAPKNSEVNSSIDFAERIKSPEFLLFSSITCLSIFCLITYYGPRFGGKHAYIYILICSLLGAFTVTACQGFGIGLKELIDGRYTYSKWLTFLCAMVIICCIIIQMVYLNRALDLFSTPIVTTIYYVLFTSCVLITSGILFREWEKLSLMDILTCLVGFSIITCGLILINNYKTNLQSNDLSFPYISSDSAFNTNVKQEEEQQHHIQVKSYANPLVNDDNFSSIMHSMNEQRQPMLLIDERDVDF